MDEYGQRLRDPVGPFNEGAHLTVICEAEGGQYSFSLPISLNQISVRVKVFYMPSFMHLNKYLIS